MTVVENIRDESSEARYAGLVSRVGIALARGATLCEMLVQCTDALVEQMDVSFARVWTVDGRTGELVLCASTGPGVPAARYERVKVGETKIGIIAHERRPHLTNKLLEDPLLGDVEWARREGLIGFAGYPLLVDDDLVGVMALYARHELPYGVMEILRSVADLVAVGIRRKEVDDANEANRDRLLQAQKMESIGRLAGGIAHEYNNLMTVVIGNIACLKDSLEPGSEGELQAGEVLDAAERAAALTQQLLAFGRKQMLQPRIVDLNEIVLRMQTMLQRLIGERIVLRVSLSSGLGAVHVDVPRLEQVIVNLVVNARDAMPEGGTVVVATDNVDVAGAGHVRLSVTDDGRGMDAKTRSRIFEPFFTTKAFGQASGLGLSAVDGIVSQSGGFIEVESEPGRGASFRVFLPRAAHAAAERPPAAVPRGTETVLVVEDEEGVLRLAHGVLSRLGYTVLEASTSERALHLCRETDGPIDLLVTDVVMPSMNGPELFRELTSMRPGLRVLYVSGYDDATVDPGAVVLPKPFTPSTLGKRVREVLDARLESGG